MQWKGITFSMLGAKLGGGAWPSCPPPPKSAHGGADAISNRASCIMRTMSSIGLGMHPRLVFHTLIAFQSTSTSLYSSVKCILAFSQYSCKIASTSCKNVNKIHIGLLLGFVNEMIKQGLITAYWSKSYTGPAAGSASRGC